MNEKYIPGTFYILTVSFTMINLNEAIVNIDLFPSSVFIRLLTTN